MIGIKIQDKLHIYDYATDHKMIGPSECHVNVNKNFKYVLEFSAAKVEDIDLKALYLGKVSSDKFDSKDVLIYLDNFIYNESGYDNSPYDLRFNNCRTFVHTLAKELGVEQSYLKIAKNFMFS